MLRVLLCAALFVPFAAAQPTYSREISRIFQSKCERCHRIGDIAPFALNSYQRAVTWAQDIKRVVSEGIMPPWKPVPGHGEFRDAYGLSGEERQAIIDWVDAETPAGDVSELPEPLPVSGEWQLGEPDAILTGPEFDVPSMKDLYRCFVIPTDFDAQKFVTAYQISPGNKQIVHHVLLFIDEKGESAGLDGKDGAPGYNCFGGPGVNLTIGGGLGGWAPGTRSAHLPDGIGVALPAKARIIMQVHYFAEGKPGLDQTKVGLYFATKPVERRLIYVPLINDRFSIPPGEKDYEVTAQYRIPLFLDAKLINIGPHMHLLGTQIRVEAEIPQKGTEKLVYIDKWDFNWQNFYTYVEPIALPAFTDVRMSCKYDNTAENPRNPNNPLKAVGWGEGTQDEMCVVFLGVTFDRENLLPFQSPR